MANWKYTLDFSNFWNDESMPIEEKGKKIATLIESKFRHQLDSANFDCYDYGLDEIYEAFNNITGYDDTTPIEEFDEWMFALYEWADQEVEPFGKRPRNAMCWIKIGD